MMSGSYTFNHDVTIVTEPPTPPPVSKGRRHSCDQTARDMCSGQCGLLPGVNEEDAEGSSNTPCRLHRRSALRRVHTLTGEPGSPRTGRSNRQRSPSTPNAPDPKMLQRGLVSHLLP
ncbi:uncharacterized protein LOC135156686 [Lytechinus pictus]|uniref:uncharacterized protein LOC135156686 n=1 Tax=Lytechinus pictus TaxID=7653 RepID=UPI0030B9E1D0